MIPRMKYSILPWFLDEKLIGPLGDNVISVRVERHFSAGLIYVAYKLLIPAS